MNHRQLKALDLLRGDARRSVYEAGGPGSKSGSGEYFVDYSNGASPTMTRADVDGLVAADWLKADPRCDCLFNRGRRLLDEDHTDG